MRVVVDSSIWSLALRRRRGSLSAAHRALVMHWSDLVRDNRAVLLGVVRQEILSGISDESVFERLRERLRGFDDEPLSTDDYERAAQFNNVCRSAGVAGSPVDFLVGAVASGRDIPVFTTDPDFARYGAHVPIRLYHPLTLNT